jgi:hypothetical protein
LTDAQSLLKIGTVRVISPETLTVITLEGTLSGRMDVVRILCVLKSSFVEMDAKKT